VSDGDGIEASVAVQFVHPFVQVGTQLNNEYFSLKKVTEVGVFRVAPEGVSQRSMQLRVDLLTSLTEPSFGAAAKT
jgi:hypothetical protein